MASSGNRKSVSGLVEKLHTSLVHPNGVPYVQMNPGTSLNLTLNDKTWLGCGILLIFLGIGVLACIMIVTSPEASGHLKSYSTSLNWDELKFTQIWGYSSCLEFKDKHSPGSFTCRYEDQPSFWSIHGIWPNREGSEGPNFCSKVQFNIDLLDPIRSSLDQYWYEMDSTKGGQYFWSHEWQKHGSCAKELDRFETELKYFSAGLDLRKQYDLSSMLQSEGIVPESPSTAVGYQLEKITHAIENTLGASNAPYVQCLRRTNSENGEAEYYLLAVELCFNKDLQLITCKSSKRLKTSLRDSALPCPDNIPIKYLSNAL